MGLKKLLFTRETFFIFAILFISSYSSNAKADYQTNLSFWGYVQDGSSDLDVTYFSTPYVYDWDNDGIRDLLVGQNYQTNDWGYVSFYKNYGTNASPSFNGFSYVQACNNTCILNVLGGG
ncbi:MAG: hypothetical protein C4538_02940 [Nitrospiraceae bacterium]|nr:MAG: hypothetical protein C4538_02940 [Nitrospiraceae bacterium]